MAERHESVDKRLYDEDYYLSSSGCKEYANGSIHRRLLRCVELVEICEGDSILDVGCGRGELLGYCASKYGCNAVGVDYSSAAIKLTASYRSHYPKGVQQRIKIYQTDAKSGLPFKSGAFDFAFMLDIVEHLYDWELNDILSEIARVLKPTGKLVIHTGPTKNVVVPARLFMRLFNMTSIGQQVHVNEQTSFSLRKHLSNYFLHNEIRVSKDRGYYQRNIDIKYQRARLFFHYLDLIFDFPPLHAVLSRKPLSYFFGTDLYSVSWGIRGSLRIGSHS